MPLFDFENRERFFREIVDVSARPSSRTEKFLGRELYVGTRRSLVLEKTSFAVEIQFEVWWNLWSNSSVNPFSQQTDGEIWPVRFDGINRKCYDRGIYLLVLDIYKERTK